MEDKSLTEAKGILQEAWPQPFKRSPVEDGRNVAMLPLKLGKHLINGIDAEVSTVEEELAKVGFTIDSEGE